MLELRTTGKRLPDTLSDNNLLAAGYGGPGQFIEIKEWIDAIALGFAQIPIIAGIRRVSPPLKPACALSNPGYTFCMPAPLAFNRDCSRSPIRALRGRLPHP